MHALLVPCRPAREAPASAAGAPRALSPATAAPAGWRSLLWATGPNPNPGPSRKAAPGSLPALYASTPARVDRTTSIGPVRFGPGAATGAGVGPVGRSSAGAVELAGAIAGHRMDRATSWGVRQGFAGPGTLPAADAGHRMERAASGRGAPAHAAPGAGAAPAAPRADAPAALAAGPAGPGSPQREAVKQGAEQARAAGAWEAVAPDAGRQREPAAPLVEHADARQPALDNNSYFGGGGGDSYFASSFADDIY